MKSHLIIFLMLMFSIASCRLHISNPSGGSVSCPADRSVMEFSGGNGTPSSPYLICDELDLAELDQKLTDAALYAQYGNKSYKQIANINLKGEIKTFLPLGMIDSPILTPDLTLVIGNIPSTRPFNGTYDGKGLSIVGMKLANSTLESYVGFFHHIGTAGVVKNLTFSSAFLDLTTAYCSGTLAGQSQGVIDNIVIQNLNAIIDEGIVFGGVVGVVSGPAKISNVTTTGTINGGLNPAYDLGTQTFTVDTQAFGGVIGAGVNLVAGTPLEITKVTNAINILAGTGIGGIMSFAFGEISATDLRNEGDIESRLEASGVFHALLQGDDLGVPGLTLSINKITNMGKVTVSGTLGDNSNASGITRTFRGGTGTLLYNGGSIINNHKISGESTGLIGGADNVTLDKIASVGNVSMNGGQTESDGTTPNSNGNVAGLIGSIGSEINAPVIITNCYVNGHIKAGADQHDIGAIVADIWDLNSNSTISRCYVASTFEGGHTYGYAPGIAYRGAAFGQIYVNASLASAITLSISNIFYATDLATNMTGGITDASSPDACSLVTGAGGSCAITTTGVLTSDLRVQGTFTGFDFATVWKTPTATSYPTFR